MPGTSSVFGEFTEDEGTKITSSPALKCDKERKNEKKTDRESMIFMRMLLCCSK